MHAIIEELNFALSYDDPSWAYFHVLNETMRNEMDKLLVSRKHPLAFLPGTQEDRFRKLHAERFQF